MLTPDQITALRDASSQLVDPIVDFLIGDIAQRVSEAGQLTGTAAYQVWQAQKLGISQKRLKKEIQKRLKVSQEQAEQLLTQAAETGYDFDISRFPTADAIPFEDNTSLQQILDASVKLAQDDLTNITQTIGFVTPAGKAVGLTEAYQQTCDFAFMKVTTGAQDYISAVREATRGLAEKGIQVIDYESGVHTSLEAAVRRNIMGGLGLMQEQISQQNHDDLGCDGWEISAHGGAAPDHEPIQGRQYDDKTFTRLNNSLQRRIGTLNCGHSAMPIIMGVNEPQYTDKELEEFRRQNEEGITYEGKHYTLYEATQRQRSLERGIRKVKRKILIDEKLGDTEKLQWDQIRLVRTREEYHRFSKVAGLPEQHERMEKAGFTWKHGKAAEGGVSQIKAPQEKTDRNVTPRSDTVEPSDVGVTLVSKNGGASKVPNIQRRINPTIITDVTDEYIQKATPRIGEITFEQGYDKFGHPHEVTIAEWLKQNFGGDIVVQSESTEDGEKRSDYLWNGKLWELKGPTTAKAPDSALRKGMSQILSNSGGIILDFRDCDVAIDEALVTINDRMTRPESIETDVMIIHRGKLIKVIRYKK